VNGKKRGLGRGLDALLSAGEPVRSLPLAALRPNRLQPRSRFDEAELEELAASIRERGLVQPLVVTPAGEGAYTIIAGERRWRAARRAGLEAVPVVVREVGGEAELLELALVENLQRADLNALEEAEAYKTLHERFGLTQEEIALRVGKGRPTVGNALRLLRLPPGVQALVRSGQLSAGQARPLLALEDAERQDELARRAVESGLSAREIETLVSQRSSRRRRRRAAAEPHAAAAAERLTQKLQTKVEITRRGRGGFLRIHFHSEEELMRLYDRLMQRGERP
jgi:ParB family chromosome partitioning protein